ncbi:YkgJ family cysteine cluster protein [Magnetovibrio blakemorei]|uniref:YkgJ family cysteine cluster protein n=1 Tax=Magnetovibrio blakemorei TaxID=28181 RepID=UPI000A067457|nr:YkgJ family cysteine cluster protein [Magnetovibrio blakemorei]
MDRHFNCIGCGKCCQGWLPLGLDDAIRHADLLPLFLLFTPVRPGGKSFEITAKYGLLTKTSKKKPIAVRITALSYLPLHTPCPALLPDGLCAVHETKPQRCRTMPLSGSRAEDDQTDLLIPKAGWECDISTEAPVVYADKVITERTQFIAERRQLEADAAILRPFGEFMMAGLPALRQDIDKMALRPQGGHVVVSFFPLLTRLGTVDVVDFAAKQSIVLQKFVDFTCDKPEFSSEHGRYQAALDEYGKVLKV